MAADEQADWLPDFPLPVLPPAPRLQPTSFWAPAIPDADWFPHAPASVARPAPRQQVAPLWTPGLPNLAATIDQWGPEYPDVCFRKPYRIPLSGERGGVDPFQYSPAVNLSYWEPEYPVYNRKVVARPQPPGLVWCPVPALPRGLLAYWKCDGNLLDSSGNGYNFSTVTDVAYESGWLGRAAVFDAALPASASRAAFHTGDRSFTITGRLRVDSNGSHHVVCQETLGGATWLVSVGTAKSGAKFLKFEFSLNPASVQTSDGSITGLGIWTPFAAWYDQNTLAMGIRVGSEVVTGTRDATTTFPVDNLNLGIVGAGPANLDGALDELAFFNRVLSSAEITAIFEGADPVVATIYPDLWLTDRRDPTRPPKRLNAGTYAESPFLPALPVAPDQWQGSFDPLPVAPRPRPEGGTVAPIQSVPVLSDWLGSWEVPATRPKPRPSVGVSHVKPPDPFDWWEEPARPVHRPRRGPADNTFYPFALAPLDWLTPVSERPVARKGGRATTETVAPLAPASMPGADWFYSDPLPVYRVRRRQDSGIALPPDLGQIPLTWLGECVDGRPALERYAPGLFNPQPWFAYPFSPPPPPPPVSGTTARTYWVALAGARYWVAGVGGMEQLVRNVITKSRGDSVRLGMDFGDLPELIAGATISSCSITATPSGDLTFSSQTTESGSYRVSAIVSGGVVADNEEPGEYEVAFAATLNTGVVVCRIGTLRVSK